MASRPVCTACIASRCLKPHTYVFCASMMFKRLSRVDFARRCKPREPTRRTQQGEKETPSGKKNKNVEFDLCMEAPGWAKQQSKLNRLLTTNMVFPKSTKSRNSESETRWTLLKQSKKLRLGSRTPACPKLLELCTSHGHISF